MPAQPDCDVRHYTDEMAYFVRKLYYLTGLELIHWATDDLRHLSREGVDGEGKQGQCRDLEAGAQDSNLV